MLISDVGWNKYEESQARGLQSYLLRRYLDPRTLPRHVSTGALGRHRTLQAVSPKAIGFRSAPPLLLVNSQEELAQAAAGGKRSPDSPVEGARGCAEARAGAPPARVSIGGAPTRPSYPVHVQVGLVTWGTYALAFQDL